MTTFYLSLTRDLVGVYLKFEAETEDDVRIHANRYYQRCWCSVYKTVPIIPGFPPPTIINASMGPVPPQYNRETGEVYPE